MENKNIPVYKVLKDDYDELYAISIVTEAAIERDFVHFGKQEKVQLKTMNEEKRIILGPALIAGKKIYRTDGVNEWYIQFDAPVIEEFSQQFLKDFNQKQITLEHEFGVNGVTVVESWIKTSNNDKSTDYGFSDVPVGSWFVSMKVESDIIWENIKNGTVNGFSIAAWISLVEEKMKINKPESNEDEDDDISDDELIDAIKKLIQE